MSMTGCCIKKEGKKTANVDRMKERDRLPGNLANAYSTPRKELFKTSLSLLKNGQRLPRKAIATNSILMGDRINLTQPQTVNFTNEGTPVVLATKIYYTTQHPFIFTYLESGSAKKHP